uniref:Uncharacterized protein n=1 Tax=Brassica oleracea TaxID=3712 RepID=A0A3P6CXT8_BRAOL|nr:unnamed protein product [Brassica oleracea]
MDPRNPYSQNSGYMGLLNNVHNNNVQENFPYESYPSTVDISASESLLLVPNNLRSVPKLQRETVEAGDIRHSPC